MKRRKIPKHHTIRHQQARSTASRSSHSARNRGRTGLYVGGLVAACAVIIFGVTAYITAQAANQPLAQVQPPLNTATSTPDGGPNAYANVTLIGQDAIVYDLTNGQVLYAKNAYSIHPLASITKLLTLYAAANVLSPAATVTMSTTSLAEVNDTADTGFTPGETFPFEDLARLTLAASSNSGAEAIAEAAESASAADQAQQNTDTTLLANAASAIGLTQTSATNSTGLDINAQVSGGYGSAHDIAVLAGALLKKYPQLAAATTEPVVSITSNQGIVHTFSNTDLDVTHIPDPLLSKTGYTDLAGGNLVVVYDAAINHPVAVVVLGSTEDGRFSDVQQLVDATLAHFAGVAPRKTALPTETASST